MSEIVSTHVDSYVYRWEGGKLKYLLLKRNERTVYGHLWQGVAGKIAGKETAVETVIRELKEETGLNPSRIFVVDHVSSFYQSYRDQVHLVPVFGVEVDSKQVRLSEEHSEFQWVDFDEALSRLSWNEQKRSLTTLNNMLHENDERMRWSSTDLETKDDGPGQTL